MSQIISPDATERSPSLADSVDHRIRSTEYRESHGDKQGDRILNLDQLVKGLPPSHIDLHITTWNMGNSQPPDDLTGIAPRKGGGYGLVVVGVQEATYSIKRKGEVTEQWSEFLQNTSFTTVGSDQNTGFCRLALAKGLDELCRNTIRTMTTNVTVIAQLQREIASEHGSGPRKVTIDLCPGGLDKLSTIPFAQSEGSVRISAFVQLNGSEKEPTYSGFQAEPGSAPVAEALAQGLSLYIDKTPTPTKADASRIAYMKYMYASSRTDSSDIAVAAKNSTSFVYRDNANPASPREHVAGVREWVPGADRPKFSHSSGPRLVSWSDYSSTPAEE